MLRDLGICLFSSLNLLIFSFIGMNYEAFKKLHTYEAGRPSLSFEEMIKNFQGKIESKQKQWPTKKMVTVQSENRAFSSFGFLKIPKLNLISPITFNTTTASIGENLSRGIISLSSFIQPENAGQTILFGHSSDYTWNQNPYATIFTLLPKLKKGDEISIYYDSKIFSYQVGDTIITDANLSELVTTSQKKNQLILSTCYPIGFFSKRFNVVANPIL